jgi:hypothetical protein
MLKMPAVLPLAALRAAFLLATAVSTRGGEPPADKESFDQSVQTALCVLAHAGPPEHFRTFYKSLDDLAKNQDDIETLRKFWDSGFRDRLQSDDPKQSPLKIWDGFHLELKSEEGGTISFGKSFRYWISFK